ncbi:MAG: hypothetical protein ACK50I_16300 [Burkholderiales bacterium]|nr:hypothetical protein [Burkholderiales bacterium]
MHWRTIAAPRPSSGSAAHPGSEAGSTGRGGGGPAAGGAAGAGARSSPDGVAQPARTAIAQAMIAARTDGERVMWVIYLEAGAAVTMVLLIVWWTMRGKK